MGYVVTTRDSNPESRPIFSIPNRGIGDALIPGFRDCEKMHKMPEKILFPKFWGQFQAAAKLRVSGLDPNTNYIIMVDIVLWAQSC